MTLPACITATPEINFKYGLARSQFFHLSSTSAKRAKVLNQLVKDLIILKRNCERTKQVFKRRDISTFEKIESAEAHIKTLALLVNKELYPALTICDYFQDLVSVLSCRIFRRY